MAKKTMTSITGLQEDIWVIINDDFQRRAVFSRRKTIRGREYAAAALT